jgi:hypothetical protein
MKAYWGSGGISPRVLDLGTRWRWVVSFTLLPLHPRVKTPATHCIGRWVEPRSSEDKKVPSFSLPGFESRPSIPQSSLYTCFNYAAWKIHVSISVHWEEGHRFLNFTKVFNAEVLLQMYWSLSHWYGNFCSVCLICTVMYSVYSAFSTPKIECLSQIFPVSNLTAELRCLYFLYV